MADQRAIRGVNRPLRRMGAGACALVVGAALAACAPGGSANDEDEDSQPEGPVSTEVPDEDITLTLAFTDGPEMVEELTAAFEEEYPQITIEEQYTQFSDYVQSLRLNMTSDSAPDIAQYAVVMKELVANGEIMDLGGYRDAYGWDEKFPTVSMDQLTSDESGKVYGTGNLYGVPAGLSLTGLYYNKELAEQAGITEPPTTLEELEQALAQAQDAGLTPISVGALDTGGIHLWAALINTVMPVENYRDWVNGVEGGTMTSDDAVAATTMFTDWAEAGYFNEGANGTGQEDTTTEFINGESVFLINGNWAAGQIAEEMGDNAGFFLMPGQDNSAEPIGSGFSVAYTMSSRTEHPEAAAAFLDFMASEQAAQVISDGGFLPVNTEAVPEQEGVLAEVDSGYQSAVENERINQFPDFAAPAMLDELTSGIQSLIAGQMEPAAFLESIQNVRDSYHEQ